LLTNSMIYRMEKAKLKIDKSAAIILFLQSSAPDGTARTVNPEREACRDPKKTQEVWIDYE